jgi:hypothetical protein
LGLLRLSRGGLLAVRVGVRLEIRVCV